MKAITFHGVGDVRATDVADPRLIDATDVLLRITTSAVCGSDLHQYHGRGGGSLVQTGATMGHEFMGVVEEASATVRNVRAGDRVIVPFSVSCGSCEWCRRRLPTQCSTTGKAVFGGRFGHVWGGGQAERIRVPFADHLCEKVPAELTHDAALFLGDILSTAYVCAEHGGIPPGPTSAAIVPPSRASSRVPSSSLATTRRRAPPARRWAPGRQRRPGRTIARQALSLTGSTNSNSTGRPSRSSASTLAGITRESLTTRQSPARSRAGRSVIARSSRVPRARSITSRRAASRVSGGACAMAAAGSS